jgi:hypothetical protein
MARSSSRRSGSVIRSITPEAPPVFSAWGLGGWVGRVLGDIHGCAVKPLPEQGGIIPREAGRMTGTKVDDHAVVLNGVLRHEINVEKAVTKFQ